MKAIVPYLLITLLCVLLAIAIVTTSDGATHLPPALGD